MAIIIANENGDWWSVGKVNTQVSNTSMTRMTNLSFQQTFTSR